MSTMNIDVKIIKILINICAKNTKNTIKDDMFFINQSQGST